MCGTSAPRMLKAQAIESGWVITAAAAPASAIALPIRRSLASAASPAMVSGKSATAPIGGSGRSAQTASTGLPSTGTSVAPVPSKAFSNRSTSAAVWSQAS